MVAVERIPVVFVDVTIVAFVDIVVLPKSGGGFDLNAVIVMPLLGVDAMDDGKDEDLLIEGDGVIGSMTKLLPLDERDVDVVFPFEDGITCKDPKVVTTFTVGGVEVMEGLFVGSGIKPLRLAKISATFLRST
jgi:hypothetical protein